MLLEGVYSCWGSFDLSLSLCIYIYMCILYTYTHTNARSAFLQASWEIYYCLPYMLPICFVVVGDAFLDVWKGVP